MKNNYVPNEVGKKVTAAVTAAAILLGGTLVAVITNRKKDHVNSDDATTTLSTTVDYKSQYGLVLTEDFDINNYDAVKKRAEEIYNISEKKYTVNEIINMIYLVNNALDKIKLDNMNEEEKFRYLQKLATGLYGILQNNLVDDTNALAALKNNEKVSVNDDNEIYSYMFISSGKEKEEAISLAILVENQLKAIKNGNIDSMDDNTNKFYTQSKYIYTNKSSYPDGILVALIDDIKSKIPVMNLSLEKAEDLSKEYQNVDVNKIWFDVADKVGAYVEADGETKVTHTKNNEKYVQSDAKSAEALVNSNTKKSNTTKKVEQGGTPVKTETITNSTKKTTTRVETSEFVVPITTTKPTTTIVDKGGEVVTEEYYYNDADEAAKLEDKTYTIKRN